MSLSHFFIYNPTLSAGREEDEHLKLLFYYPAHIHNDKKMKHMGVLQAIVALTQFELNLL